MFIYIYQKYLPLTVTRHEELRFSVVLYIISFREDKFSFLGQIYICLVSLTSIRRLYRGLRVSTLSFISGQVKNKRSRNGRRRSTWPYPSLRGADHFVVKVYDSWFIVNSSQLRCLSWWIDAADRTYSAEFHFRLTLLLLLHPASKLKCLTDKDLSTSNWLSRNWSFGTWVNPESSRHLQVAKGCPKHLSCSSWNKIYWTIRTALHEMIGQFLRISRIRIPNGLVSETKSLWGRKEWGAGVGTEFELTFFSPYYQLLSKVLLVSHSTIV